MSKLSKEQKRKKKIKTAKKVHATATCNAERIKNMNERSHNDFGTSDECTSFDDLSQVQYQLIYDEYIAKSASEREPFLTRTAEKYQLSFDPDVILEMIIDEFKANVSDLPALLEVANSETLKFYEIADEIERAGFQQYSDLMRPVIKECEFDTGIS